MLTVAMPCLSSPCCLVNPSGPLALSAPPSVHRHCQLVYNTFTPSCGVLLCSIGMPVFFNKWPCCILCSWSFILSV